MKQDLENPKLNPGLKAAYRNVPVFEHMHKRVLARLEQSPSPWRLQPGFAGALICVLVLSMLLLSGKQQEGTVQSGLPDARWTGNGLSRLAAVQHEVNRMRIPALSSLGALPSVSQFKTPHSSQYSPGQFCLYQPSGERKC